MRTGHSTKGYCNISPSIRLKEEENKMTEKIIKISNKWYLVWWDNRNQQWQCGNSFGIHGAEPEMVARHEHTHFASGFKTKAELLNHEAEVKEYGL